MRIAVALPAALPAALGLLLALAFAGRPAVALAGEKRVKEADVPTPVLDTVKKKYPGATLRGFSFEEEDGQSLYEISITAAGKSIDIDVSAAGKILAEETIVAAGDLPAGVKQGIAGSPYASWKILRAERIVHDEKEDTASYEVLLQSKGHKVEVQLDAGGKVTKTEPKNRKDADND